MALLRKFVYDTMGKKISLNLVGKKSLVINGVRVSAEKIKLAKQTFRSDVVKDIKLRNLAKKIGVDYSRQKPVFTLENYFFRYKESQWGLKAITGQIHGQTLKSRFLARAPKGQALYYQIKELATAYEENKVRILSEQLEQIRRNPTAFKTDEAAYIQRTSPFVDRWRAGGQKRAWIIRRRTNKFLARV